VLGAWVAGFAGAAPVIRLGRRLEGFGPSGGVGIRVVGSLMERLVLRVGVVARELGSLLDDGTRGIRPSRDVATTAGIMQLRGDCPKVGPLRLIALVSCMYAIGVRSSGFALFSKRGVLEKICFTFGRGDDSPT